MLLIDIWVVIARDVSFIYNQGGNTKLSWCHKDNIRTLRTNIKQGNHVKLNCISDGSTEEKAKLKKYEKSFQWMSYRKICVAWKQINRFRVIFANKLRIWFLHTKNVSGIFCVFCWNWAEVVFKFVCSSRCVIEKQRKQSPKSAATERHLYSTGCIRHFR